MKQRTEERKALNAAASAWRATPEGVEARARLRETFQKARDASPGGKLTRKEWDATDAGKAALSVYQRARNADPGVKAATKARDAKRYASPDGKAAIAAYQKERNATPGRKAELAARNAKRHADPEWRDAKAEYNAKRSASPKGKAYAKEYYAKRHADPEWRAAKAEYNAKRYASLEGRAKEMLSSAAKRAKVRGGVCTLTLEWVIARILLGCALSGHAFVLTKGKHGRTPSIDRIDTSNPDYTPENSRVILLLINIAMNKHGLDAYIERARDVFKHLGIYINDPKLEALLTTMQESR